MDILIKLRVLLWSMVLALWGLMIYQFLEEDGRGAEQNRMRWVSSRVAVDALEDLPDLESLPQIPMDELFSEEESSDLTPSHAGRAAAPEAQAESKVAYRTPIARPDPFPVAKPMPPALRAPPPKAPPSYKGVAGKTERETRGRSLGETPVRAARPKPAVRPREAAPQAPKGFVRLQNEHFVVFSQGQPASQEFMETLGDLHENLMKDLASFSPWARSERVTVFLFRDQESYQKVTGRPSWSGGASSVKRRKIYVYASEELVGILAHELTHIYFDSFFLAGRESPLWLSEGMATLVQTERGLSAPNWLRGNMETLRAGGGYDLRDLMRVDSTGGAADGEVRLWYTQAYSVVRFMIRSQRRASFYKFCRMLRDGTSPKSALYRAYGMPFNSFHALEYAWRHQVERG